MNRRHLAWIGGVVVLFLVVGVLVFRFTGEQETRPGAIQPTDIVLDDPLLKPTDLRSQRPVASEVEALRAKAESEGPLNLMVALRMPFAPEGLLDEGQVAQQQRRIRVGQDALVAALAGIEQEGVTRFRFSPYIRVEEAGPETIDMLKGSPQVASVREEEVFAPALEESIGIVQAPLSVSRSTAGTGQVVAVLDTGTSSHAVFGEKDDIVAEACYTVSTCPNGTGSQTGSGSARPYSSSLPGWDHGTHVAGIASGAVTPRPRQSALRGVAPGARLMAVQVFRPVTCPGDIPCLRSREGDIKRGLERVYALRNRHQFAAVNLSLASGRFTSACDSSSLKASVDNLRAVGIATIAASGNFAIVDGQFRSGIAHPACISTVISVGNTTKNDRILNSSQSAGILDLLAPGTGIISSVPVVRDPAGGWGSMSGTSMAAPHVAGAWATLRHARPTASVPAILNALSSSGRWITDGRFPTMTNVTKRRIDVAGALQLRWRD